MIKYWYLQHHALDMLSLAIKHGDLTPATNCEKCGKESDDRPLDGHHTDYSKPLEVIWLCRSCHLKEHHTDIKRRKTSRPRIRLADVAHEIYENGDHKLSAAEMMAKYQISLGSTTKIREILTTNGFSHKE